MSLDKYSVEDLITELKKRGLQIDEEEESSSPKKEVKQLKEEKQAPTKTRNNNPVNKPKTKVQCDWDEFGPALYNDFINNKMKIVDLMQKYDRKKYTVSELIKIGKKQGCGSDLTYTKITTEAPQEVEVNAN